VLYTIPIVLQTSVHLCFFIEAFNSRFCRSFCLVFVRLHLCGSIYCVNFASGAVVQTANTITVDFRHRPASTADFITPDAWKGEYEAIIGEHKKKPSSRLKLPFAQPLPRPQIQLIQFHNHPPHSILSTFDIDLCSFAFDGQDVHALDRARQAITSGRISAPLQHRAWRSCSRLLKYCAREYALHVPDLDWSIDNSELLAEGAVVFFYDFCVD